MVHARRQAVKVTLGAGQLRAAAALLERLTRVRIELPAGQPKRGKHLGLILSLERQLRAALPPAPALAVVQGAAIELAGTEGEYVTPDLVVCPAGFLDSDELLLHPRVVTLAVVIGRPRATADIPALILHINPHTATWTLNTHPHPHPGTYGDPIPLPAPFTSHLTTTNLPRYDGQSQHRA
jgi:hypothetical protein